MSPIIIACRLADCLPLSGLEKLYGSLLLGEERTRQQLIAQHNLKKAARPCLFSDLVERERQARQEEQTASESVIRTSGVSVCFKKLFPTADVNELIQKCPSALRNNTRHKLEVRVENLSLLLGSGVNLGKVITLQPELLLGEFEGIQEKFVELLEVLGWGRVAVPVGSALARAH